MTIDRGSLNLSFLSIIIVESFTIHCMQEWQNTIGLEVEGGGWGWCSLYTACTPTLWRENEGEGEGLQPYVTPAAPPLIPWYQEYTLQVLPYYQDTESHCMHCTSVAGHQLGKRSPYRCWGCLRVSCVRCAW